MYGVLAGLYARKGWAEWKEVFGPGRCPGSTLCALRSRGLVQYRQSRSGWPEWRITTEGRAVLERGADAPEYQPTRLQVDIRQPPEVVARRMGQLALRMGVVGLDPYASASPWPTAQDVKA